ncbi:MAG: NosD domain-containing protein [Thermosphaera sp.]
MSVILMKTTTLLTSPLLLGFFAASTGLCLNVTIGEDSSTHEVTGCVDITAQGSYRLFTNITGLQEGKDYCIGITASNVVVDGAGYSLTGTGVGIGIYVIDGFNITLMNLYISSYHCGIDLLGPVYASIFNNTLTGINGEGLRLLDSDYDKLFYNTFMNISGEALSLVNSDNNTVNHNLIAYSKTGIYLDSLDNNKIFNNSVFNASEQGPLPLSGEGGSDGSVIIVVAVAKASTALIILYASRKRRSSGH